MSATLSDLTVKQLKDLASQRGISPETIREVAGGKTPTKATYLKILSEAGVVAWDPPESKNPADLTRKGLLAGIPDDEIRRAVAARYPDYKALKICVPVYRRELRKKGLLAEGD